MEEEEELWEWESLFSSCFHRPSVRPSVLPSAIAAPSARSGCCDRRRGGLLNTRVRPSAFRPMDGGRKLTRKIWIVVVGPRRSFPLPSCLVTSSPSFQFTLSSFFPAVPSLQHKGKERRRRRRRVRMETVPESLPFIVRGGEHGRPLGHLQNILREI